MYEQNKSLVTFCWNCHSIRRTNPLIPFFKQLEFSGILLDSDKKINCVKAILERMLSIEPIFEEQHVSRYRDGLYILYTCCRVNSIKLVQVMLAHYEQYMPKQLTWHSMYWLFDNLWNHKKMFTQIHEYLKEAETKQKLPILSKEWHFTLRSVRSKVKQLLKCPSY